MSSSLSNLQHRQFSITDQALNLGYVDVTNFNRNFKNWTGEFTRDWKARHLKAPLDKYIQTQN